MKRSDQKTLPLVFVFLFFVFAVQSTAQLRKSKLFLDAGTAIPTNKDLNDVFTGGLSAAIGPVIPVLNEKLSIQPLGGVKWFLKQITDENSLTEHFRNWKAGVSVSYMVAGFKNIRFCPLFRLDYNWCANYYSETYDYDVYNGMSSVALSDKYLKGKGISYDIGMKIQKSKWSLKIDHEFFKPKLSVNEKLRSDAWNQGFWIPEKYTYNLNSFCFSIGYQLIPLK